MTASTQILPFSTVAAGSGGNRLTPSAYAALTALLADGFQAGVAQSVQVNTVLAQTSFMAAGLANWMVSQGVSVPDDGNLTNLVSEISSALSAYISSVTAANLFLGGTTTGSANAQVIASLSPAAGFSLSNNGATIICTAGFTNTGAMTVAVTTPSISATSVKIDSGAGLIDPPAGAVVAGNTISLTVNTTSGVLVLDAGLPASLFLQKANNLSDVASTSTALSNLGGAPLASPTFTGTPSLPTGTTAVTQTTTDSSTKPATTAFVQANKIATNFAIGSYISASCTSTVASGSTTAAANLTPAIWQINGASGGPTATGDSITGTWGPVTSYTIAANYILAVWQRKA
jgi:hypothetical protein